MKIVAISDTHNKHKQIATLNGADSLSGDVIIHSGDATGRGESGEIIPFLDWFASLDFTHKIFVPGNHDWGFEREPKRYQKECDDRGIILLINKYIEIDSTIFWGSPASPWFYSWAFNYRRTKEEADKFQLPYIGDIWEKIPSDTNVLITHGPPMGILDKLIHVDENVGCAELLKAVNLVKPAIHIFGHIHCGYGTLERDGIRFYNASICGESYKADNLPHVIYL